MFPLRKRKTRTYQRRDRYRATDRTTVVVSPDRLWRFLIFATGYIRSSALLRWNSGALESSAAAIHFMLSSSFEHLATSSFVYSGTQPQHSGPSISLAHGYSTIHTSSNRPLLYRLLAHSLLRLCLRAQRPLSHGSDGYRRNHSKDFRRVGSSFPFLRHYILVD